jgi:hypothetical protein
MVRNLSITWEDKNKWIDIDGRKGFNILYSSVPTGYGMQCNYDEADDSKEYKMVLDVLKNIRDNVSKLIELNETPFEKDTEGLTYE